MTNVVADNTCVEKPEVISFFDKDTSTFTYIVKDVSTDFCAVIDPVLNFDYASGKTSYESADQIIAYIERHRLKLQWIIETHVHADHVTCAPYIQQQLGGEIAVGEQITVVQNTFASVFNEGEAFKRDGSQFGHLFSEGEEYKIGNMQCRAMHTPGHTPACMTHVIGDAVFVGDTLFMPDGGTARADFPGGDAGQLYDSIQRILALPEHYRVFVCHDYQPNGRELAYLTTVNQEKQSNIHVKTGISKDDFIKMREKRDGTLSMPRLILPSLQINMRAGLFPPAEDDGEVYLKIPVNKF